MSESSVNSSSGAASEHSFLEIVAAVLLGVAAVAISFSAYQSALWGGVQDTALTESVLTSNGSVDLLQNADTTLTTDQTLFLQILTADDCVDVESLVDVDPLTICGQIFGGLSVDGKDAVIAWEESEDLYPFETDEYLTIYDPGNELEEESAVLLADAKVANKNGDKYELASTFLTTTLFFAGISLVIRSRSIKSVLLLASVAILASASVYMLTLPKTF